MSTKKHTFKSYGMHRTGPTTLASWLMAGQAFSNATGTFHGTPFPVGKGRLPKEFEDSLNEADYVVYSYGTPIAWHVPAQGTLRARWIEPNVKYSQTTTAHQSRLSIALNIAKVWSS